MNTMQQAAPDAKFSTPAEREIRVERVFNAPRALVWRAYTDAQWVAQWWGRGNPLTVERYEVERGGHWRFVEHSAEGDHGFEGRFREVTPMDRIVQTFEWDGLPGYPCVQTEEFTDVDGGRTKVTSTLFFFTGEERDGMLNSGIKTGLNEAYAALDALLARVGG